MTEDLNLSLSKSFMIFIKLNLKLYCDQSGRQEIQEVDRRGGNDQANANGSA